MTGFVQAANRAFWEIILVLPMPWRAGLVVFIAGLFFKFGWRLLKWLIIRLALFLFFLIEGIASILLFPEYLITNYLRQSGQRPFVGTYTFGDFLQKIVGVFYSWMIRVDGIQGKWRLSTGWIVLIVAIPIFLWFVRPYVEDTTAVRYVDYGLSFWASIERWGLTGTWVPPASVFLK